MTLKSLRLHSEHSELSNLEAAGKGGGLLGTEKYSCELWEFKQIVFWIYILQNV